MNCDMEEVFLHVYTSDNTLIIVTVCVCVFVGSY